MSNRKPHQDHFTVKSIQHAHIYSSAGIKIGMHIGQDQVNCISHAQTYYYYCFGILNYLAFKDHIESRLIQI